MENEKNVSIKDEESLKYELGVLLYNAYNSNSSGEYDIQGNFSSIMNSLNLDIDELKDGFIHEGLNYGLEDEEIEEMFESAKNLF